MKAWKNTPLHIKIFVLLIIGCAIGFLFGERVTVLAQNADCSPGILLHYFRRD